MHTAVCYEGDIQLTGGPTSYQGTVVLCAINQWNTICHQRWSANDAKVVCRQLGFNASELYILSISFQSTLSFPCTGVPVYNSYYGSGSSSYSWINVAGGCVGNETRLLSCPRTPTSTQCFLVVLMDQCGWWLCR